ncbi:hypothetical protein CIPAW_12G142500 [Carya illinoinensis]|uniref:High mobility group B protein 10 n=1 Tax=Carya illinoinensis TaxID=32201 RepID=A0A8T1NZS9_CARIL|nr:hypothetical protein CIPAW_12G142500 [Carya illinoinensis]
MSTHFHYVSQDPTTTTTVTENPSPISAQRQRQQKRQSGGESTNGQFSVTTAKIYPSATASYEGVAQSSDLFCEKLKAFHQSFGTKFMVPTVGGKPLDLHRLFVEVTSRGGLENIIRDRKWKEVIVAFNFPTTVTSASFVLRKYYLSLLYHFEQVYFHKQVSSTSEPDPVSRHLVSESATLEEGATRNEFSATTRILSLGCLVTGTIDGKFDNGYLVAVNLANPTRGNQKRSKLALCDPSWPKSNRSGYNFFFAEHYARLKPLYHGQEKDIGKKIGFLWSNLTEAGKQVYQEKGLRDKERYRTEMLGV